MVLEVKKLNAWFGTHHVLKDISIAVPENEVLAFIGPSGCGKSTFLRCLNRLHEETKSARAEGRILFRGQDIQSKDVDPVALRRNIGMVFQKPVPFAGLSILENAHIGLKLNGLRNKTELKDRAEAALKKAALWNEVENKLDAPGTSLSGGQQQRLCIARSLAVEPQVLLMDEPTSALDPISTASIEELVKELKKSVTVVIVTHNMQQAQRVADKTAFFYLGELIEHGKTQDIFQRSSQERTRNYVSGHFG